MRRRLLPIHVLTLVLLSSCSQRTGVDAGVDAPADLRQGVLDVAAELGSVDLGSVDGGGEAGASCQAVAYLQEGDTVGSMANQCSWTSVHDPNAPAAAVVLPDEAESMGFQIRIDIDPETYAHQGYVSMPSLAEISPVSAQGMEVVGPNAGAAKGEYFFDLQWANQVRPKEGLRLTLTATFSFACASGSSRVLAATTTAELVLCRSSSGGLAWTPAGGPCDCSTSVALSRDCSRCHGQNGDPTPPPAVDGTTSTESIGVGAHQVHVRGTGLARPVPCKECHVVPTVADGVEHPDPNGLPAAVVFGLLGKHDSAAPAWDRTTGTCTDVFCHGSTLRAAETRPSRIWTAIDETQRRCDACHGYPPRPSHPQRTDCEACHYMVVSANGVIMNPLLHVDGVLQADITVSP